MKRSLSFVVLVAVFVFGLVVVQQSGVANAQDIKIGVAGPITGPYAKFGEQLTRGANAAAEAINKRGGIKGHKVVIVPGDDACDPKQARAVANRMVNDKVYAVAGHFCSSSTIPASEVYDEANILQITPASTNPLVTERGLPAVFRTCGRDDQQGSVAAEYIARELKGKRVAVIHDKDTYGQGLADAMKSALNKNFAIKEVLYEGVTRGDKDFNSLVTKMKGLNVDVIYFGGLHTEAGLIRRQAMEQGLNAEFLSGDGIVSDEFANIAGPSAVGVLMTFGADPTKSMAAKQIVEQFRAGGYEPEGYTLYSYATIQVIADALEATNVTRDGEKLAEYLKSHAFNTVMGKKEFDEKGDLKVSDYVVYRWFRDGGKITYKQITNL
ncbi:MAG: branched-chain amino acid ABC transporter substrate-binding protein [Candidatus Lambdaproteobacteria bacterium]|nr:branched-chain amino acid ABC transporter substrate-binding protein [Candidatus Lambdaproteobacteria bacterium]